MEERDSKGRTILKVSATFKAGAVCLAFFIVGYQVCLFVKHSAVLAVQSRMDSPDTVYVYVTPKIVSAPQPPDTVKSIKRAQHHPAVARVRESLRRVESFVFDPNTASVEDLVRLGFSEKQALSIEAYRQKGGRFRRPADFARSYVVADSVFERLAPYISIPLIDINKADSATFDSLPGIGGYFASKMVAYREELGGYSHTGQLMDIYNFTPEKYEALKDLVYCSPAGPFDLWGASEEDLRRHPYIRGSARGIVIFRKNNPRSRWTVECLHEAGVLNGDQARKLGQCRLLNPS